MAGQGMVLRRVLVTNRAVVLLCLVVLLGSGCSSVTTTQPLPLTAQPADQEALEGTWLMDSTDPLQLRFQDDGVGQLAGLEWDEQGFHLERCEVIVTDGSHGRFLSTRCFEGGRWETTYNFVRYTIAANGDLVLWLPRPEAFAREVSNGNLAGTVSDESSSPSVLITAEPTALLNLVDDPDRDDLFDLADPMVVRKLQAECAH